GRGLRRGGAGPAGACSAVRTPPAVSLLAFAFTLFAFRCWLRQLFALLLLRLQFGDEPLKVLPVAQGVEVSVFFHVGGVLVTPGDRLPQQFDGAGGVRLGEPGRVSARSFRILD